MNYIEVNTSDLIGPALDWAVARADGLNADIHKAPLYRYEQNSKGETQRFRNGTREFLGVGQNMWSPSTLWSQSGPLIEKYKLCIDPWRSGCAWHASSKELKESGYGNSPLEAACRAIVASKLGDTVQVPIELMP